MRLAVDVINRCGDVKPFIHSQTGSLTDKCGEGNLPILPRLRSRNRKVRGRERERGGIQLRQHKTTGTNGFAPAAVFGLGYRSLTFRPPTCGHDAHRIAPGALSRAAAQRADLDPVSFPQRCRREQHSPCARVIDARVRPRRAVVQAELQLIHPPVQRKRHAEHLYRMKT